MYLDPPKILCSPKIWEPLSLLVHTYCLLYLTTTSEHASLWWKSGCCDSEHLNLWSTWVIHELLQDLIRIMNFICGPCPQHDDEEPVISFTDSWKRTLRRFFFFDCLIWSTQRYEPVKCGGLTIFIHLFYLYSSF